MTILQGRKLYRPWCFNIWNFHRLSTSNNWNFPSKENSSPISTYTSQHTKKNAKNELISVCTATTRSFIFIWGIWRTCLTSENMADSLGNCFWREREHRTRISKGAQNNKLPLRVIIIIVTVTIVVYYYTRVSTGFIFRPCMNTAIFLTSCLTLSNGRWFMIFFFYINFSI